MDEAFRAFMYSALMPFCFLYLPHVWVQPSLRAADESRANALCRPWPLWVCASISARIIASRKILRSLETNGLLQVRSCWRIVILVLVAFHHLREWNISLFKGPRLGILLFFHCALFLCSLSLWVRFSVPSLPFLVLYGCQKRILEKHLSGVTELVPSENKAAICWHWVRWGRGKSCTICPFWFCIKKHILVLSFA